MTLLIMDLMTGEKEEWLNYFQRELPSLEVRFWPDIGNLSDIQYLAFGRQYFDDLPNLPNLKFMMTRQAGVDAWIKHPKIPKVPLTKLEPESGDPMMTEYVVMHVLRLHRNIPEYRSQQAKKIWQPLRQHRPEERKIGFLGYGTLARPPIQILSTLGFDIAAWARTPKKNTEMPIYHGKNQLKSFLNRTEIAVCLLPLTIETKGIINSKTISMMPKGAMIINIGRGEHVVDDDLIEALDSGQLSAASLDTTSPEPLPQDSSLWSHPKVTIMPHVARRPPVKQLAPQIVINIQRLEEGQSLLQPVDVEAGY